MTADVGGRAGTEEVTDAVIGSLVPPNPRPG